MPDPFLAPEMIWIADGKIHGYRESGDGWQVYDGEKWVSAERAKPESDLVPKAHLASSEEEALTRVLAIARGLSEMGWMGCAEGGDVMNCLTRGCPCCQRAEEIAR